MATLLSFFSFKSHTVRHASLLLAASAVLSNGLGLLRDILLYRFHPYTTIDVYVAGFTVGDLLFNLLIFGGMSSALVPVLSEKIINKDEASANRIVNELLTWAFFVFGGICLLLALLMNVVTPVLVPGFDSESVAFTVLLSRIVLLQTFLFSISFIFGALLNAHRRFTSYALAPLAYNTSIIAGIFVSARWGITMVTWAAVIGAAIHCAIQFREARMVGFKIQPSLNASRELRHVAVMMIPRSLAQGMNQILVTVYRALASLLTRGSIAIFSGMNNLQTTPTSVVATSLATALLPKLSAAVAENNKPEVDALVSKTINTALFLLIPIVALAYVLRAQAVRLYIATGSVSWELTGLAVLTFVCFLIGVIPSSLITIFGRIFYARKDTWSPMYIALIGGLVGISYAVVAIRIWNLPVWALALAESLNALTQCILFAIALRRNGYLTYNLEDGLARVIRYSGGAVILAWFTWATLQAVDIVYRRIDVTGTASILGLLIQAAIAGLVGAIVYFGYSALISKEELQWISKGRFSKLR